MISFLVLAVNSIWFQIFCSYALVSLILRLRQLSVACRRAWERGYAHLVSPVEVLVTRIKMQSSDQFTVLFLRIKVTSKWQNSADERYKEVCLTLCPLNH